MNDRKHPARLGVVRSSFLRVRGPAPVTFRVDPAGPERAMFQGAHASLTHLERALPEGIRPLSSPLGQAITGARSREDAARAAHELLASHGLEVDRRDEPRSPIRRHPGARLTPGPSHRLVDHELLGLRLGLRTIAKRMCLPGGSDDRAARLREQGFAVTWFGVTRHGALSAEREVILVARDEAVLSAASDVERALVEAASARTDDSGAVREMGALLGYPRCCVERFVALRARDDASLAGALLGPLGTPSPFATAFTVPPFTLVSHAPCSPHCEATCSLVASLLAATDDDTRAAYARLSRASWGIDDEGLVVRRLDGEAHAIDVADPELTLRPIDAPDPTTLHWQIEGLGHA